MSEAANEPNTPQSYEDLAAGAVERLRQIADQDSPNLHIGTRTLSVRQAIAEIEQGTELGRELVEMDQSVHAKTISQIPSVDIRSARLGKVLDALAKFFGG